MKESRRQSEKGCRVAPEGFTAAQWESFAAEGVLIVENALTDQEVEVYLDGIDRMLRTQEQLTADDPFRCQNFVEKDPVFADLIDHPKHLGFVYDLFGEMLKLQISELFVRPPKSGGLERWHYDGPRVVPYSVFSNGLPFQVRVAYWLTDTNGLDMGNFMYVPGSHRHPYFAAYNTLEDISEAVSFTARRGTMMLFDTALWHRTAPNESGQTRKSLLLGYSPSWLPTSDRIASNPEWLSALNREQRIIMRSYDSFYAHAKPPPEDFPLFVDPDDGSASQREQYRDIVPLHYRKRQTGRERTDRS